MKYLNSSAAKRSFCRHWNIYSVRQDESWYLCFHKAKEPFSSWIQSRNYFSCQSLTWIKSSPHQCGPEAIGGENWVSTEENRATAQRMWSYFQSRMIKAMCFFFAVLKGTNLPSNIVATSHNLKVNFEQLLKVDLIFYKISKDPMAQIFTDH